MAISLVHPPLESEHAMPSLERILREQFDFKDEHFDEHGRVQVNSMDGSISSLPTASAQLANTKIQIADILKVGQELGFKASADDRKHRHLRILEIASEGLTAISVSGEVGFFPWAILSFGFSSPSHMEITSFSQALDSPLSTLRAANEHMERRLTEQKAAVRITEDLLAVIGKQMKPSTQAKLSSR